MCRCPSNSDTTLKGYKCTSGVGTYAAAEVKDGSWRETPHPSCIIQTEGAVFLLHVSPVADKTLSDALCRYVTSVRLNLVQMLQQHFSIKIISPSGKRREPNRHTFFFFQPVALSYLCKSIWS